MTRNEALETARANYKAHRAAVVDHLFGRTSSAPDDAAFGYRHGWYTVGDFCFDQTEITGEPYDMTQGGGGWAYL